MSGDRAAVRARLLRSGRTKPGPDSISWKVNRECIAVIGWGRAIAMQLAHPAIAAGVRDHSSFQRGLRTSLQRLRSTVDAMLAIMFGDTEQMITAAARINAIHDRVHGPIPGDGHRTYSAHDPELLRWVQATLVDSILGVYDRLVTPLTPGERDQYCRDTGILEPLLNMPDGWLPRDAAQLDAILRDTIASGTLTVTDDARVLARAVLYPPYWRLAWPLFRPMQLLTIGLLPAPLREAYGFDWRPEDARALERWSTMLRTVVRLTPPFARRWPAASRRGASLTPAAPRISLRRPNGLDPEKAHGRVD